MKKAALHNLGCKVNSYETEAMQELLENRGYQIVPFEEKADVYIINTCSVTNMADRKSRQMLHRAKKRNPDAVVVAAGCYVQSAGKELLEDPAVDILIGNNEKSRLPDILEEWDRSKARLHLHDMLHEREYEGLSLGRTAGHTRAYMKIQDGCDQFCSYCIIPYTRGRMRSRSLPDILSEAVRLAERGYQEIVLTGIHLDSYGADLAGEENSLLTVIQKTAEVDGIRRIRLGSLEPRIMTEEFVKGLSETPKLCPHFHLSLQSGCDGTLMRMNRKYCVQEFRECCRRLRAHFADPALTTDVIVGFPGETGEEFEETVRFLEEIRFYETHVFKYSRRKGTRADRMPDQVPEEEKARRSDVLLRLSEKNRHAYVSRFEGRTVEVLMEEACELRGRRCQIGHTKEYVRVAVPETEDLSNRFCQVCVDRCVEDDILYGFLGNADRK